MRIDAATKAEIAAKTDIGAFIGGYVQLHKRGRDLVGLCPFHGEKTPSFHVHPDKGFFKCFGCGKAGDVYDFVMERENVPFPEAVRMLARRAGVALAEEDPAAARVRGEKERIYAANEIAAAFFHRTLRIAPEAQKAREYVAGRGIAPATVEAFKLGYAPASWDALLRELEANGVDGATAVKAGLAKEGDRKPYDVFRDRLMIPTYATTGETVAFGGRAFDDQVAKYINTSTTPVYTKGRGLYALNVARRSPQAHDERRLIVVEGYLDCIALHQTGFANTVASLGTAFTPEQAAELKKYADRIFLCFDADAAGSNATAKSVDVLVAAGCEPFIVELPPGEDPDSFVRGQGSAAFGARLAAAVPWMQFKLDRDIGQVRTLGLSRAQAAARAEALVRALPRTEWDRWRVYAAKGLELSPDDLRGARIAADPTHLRPREGTRHAPPRAEPPSLGREVLATLLDEPGLMSEYGAQFAPEFFEDARLRAIFEALRERADTLASLPDVYAALGEDREAVDVVVTLLKPDRSSAVRFQDSESRRAHLDRVLQRLETERMERRRRELDERMNAAFESGRTVPREERDEFQALVEELDRRNERRLGTK